MTFIGKIRARKMKIECSRQLITVTDGQRLSLLELLTEPKTHLGVLDEQTCSSEVLCQPGGGPRATVQASDLDIPELEADLLSRNRL